MVFMFTENCLVDHINDLCTAFDRKGGILKYMWLSKFVTS